MEKGASFSIELELPHVEEADAAISSASDRGIVGYQGERRKVLVIDKSELNRTVAIDLLENYGFLRTGSRF